MSNSTLDHNGAAGGQGGGIYNNGTLVLSKDTLRNNVSGAGLGGGISNDSSGAVSVTNCTFSDNFGGLAGGGIISSGAVTVTNSTFTANNPGGLVNGGSNQMVLKNTIVAGNDQYNCSGTITSSGHNLDSGNTCAFTAAGDLTDTDPRLGPWAYYLWSTALHPLLPGSPAVNAGDNDGCPATDQRGMPRPQLGTCDIGAFELVLKIYLPAVRK